MKWGGSFNDTVWMDKLISIYLLWDKTNRSIKLVLPLSLEEVPSNGFIQWALTNSWRVGAFFDQHKPCGHFWIFIVLDLHEYVITLQQEHQTRKR